jgi:hypothetical protein
MASPQKPIPLDYATPPVVRPLSIWVEIRSLAWKLVLLDILVVPAIFAVNYAGSERLEVVLGCVFQPLPFLALAQIGRRESFWTNGSGCPGMILANAVLYGFVLGTIIVLAKRWLRGVR